MNERIRELAEQAKLNPVLLLQHWGTNDALTDSEQESLERIEKFAELIVRECAQFIFVLDAEPVSHKSAARMLQEHFGVK